MSGIDHALLDGVPRSLKPYREAFIEGAVDRWQPVQLRKGSAYCQE
jgi:hypothetical protein